MDRSRRAPKIDDWLAPAGLISELGWLALAVVLLFAWTDRHAPSQDLPWKPLDLAAEPGLFTKARLNAVEGEACRAAIARTAVTPQAVADRTEGEFCSIVDAVRISPTELAAPAPVMVCRQAAAYLVWERQFLQPLAREILGSRVVRVQHFGTYACRRQYGASEGRVSEHALANALDVAGFILADGRRITVADDWTDGGDRGRFLRAVRDGACQVFDVTLSPDYNVAHRDHLHLDMGPYQSCR